MDDHDSGETVDRRPRQFEKRKATSRDIFTYESLPDSNSYIRLLEIAEGADSSPTQCRLSVWKLSEVPRYAAISYTWGSSPSLEHPPQTIWIDGKAMDVWQNCHDALRQVRWNLVDVLGLGLDYIWIDSICINQADLEEKGAQVQIMASHIFPKAMWVFLSLGSESDGSQEFLERLVQFDDQGLAFSRNGTWENNGGYDACVSLGRRPYWKRLWVLPEIFTAQGIQIMCGSHMIHWRLLKNFLEGPHMAKQQGTRVGRGQISDTPLWKVCETKDAVGSRIAVSQLEKLLESHSDWGCADSRDRFYAFWSILDWPPNTVRPKVDYRTPKIELARNVLRLVCCQGTARRLSTVCSSICKLLTAFAVTPDELGSYGLFTSTTSARERDLEDTDWYRPIYVDLSNDIVATIIADKNGKMTVPITSLDIQEQSTYAKPRGASCRPLFRGSSILGWLCPAATFGDLLLKVEVGTYRLYLVLRPLEDPKVRIYKILGQASIDSSFDIVPDKKESLGSYAYSCIATSDLITLAAPIFLNQGFVSERSMPNVEHMPPTIIWPAREDLALVHVSPFKMDGAGHEIVECVACGRGTMPSKDFSRLPCSHCMCHVCLKKLFEASVDDPARMPPKCCTKDHIPLKYVERLLDVEFKKLWNRKYQEYHTQNRIYCPNPKCGEWVKPSKIHTLNGCQSARCARCKTTITIPLDSQPENEEQSTG